MKLLKYSFFLLLSLVITTSCDDDDDSSGGGSECIENLDGNLICRNIRDGETLTLLEDSTYRIEQGIFVEEGGTLIIQPGVVVEAQAIGSSPFLLVEAGATIRAIGTRAKPIIFTSDADTPRPGDWGGIILNGLAPVNAGDDVVAEVGDARYGGSDEEDDSGELRYVIVAYGGDQINSEKEHNGFTFNGVGSGTELAWLMAYECSDDGMEWFGGTVEGSNLVTVGSEDDLFDWTFGWTGSATNIYGKQFEDANRGGDRGIEADNNETNNALTPVSSPTISNLTLLGNGRDVSGMKLRRGTGFKFSNVVIDGFGGIGIDIESELSLAQVADGDATFENISVDTDSIDFTVNLSLPEGTEPSEDNLADSTATVEAIETALEGSEPTGAPQDLIDFSEEMIDLIDAL
ncbi:hypothetical protein [Sediminitomix flava]|uniref:Uncharacterized protein n=1 Tax=Sediminitomix flava TaxID=379075 RepID=A0A315ZHI0_SEDFL|nr:hypothetical protein [Sediminitomix flava]PWJ44164.1 hypothetical protein BC781_101514 [Sediminitomix flava]